MFLCQPLLEVFVGRGIGDIDAFLKAPSWSDLPDPFSIPSMEKAAARVLRAIRHRERITIHGDYDCDGVLGSHILRSVLSGVGAPARTFLPHRDEGYGLSSSDDAFAIGGRFPKPNLKRKVATTPLGGDARCRKS
jgi:single-stranded-DNA-specific exonuclease